MFTVKNDVIIPGDFTIKCGDIVQCDFPQLKGGREQEINRQSGDQTHGENLFVIELQERIH